MLDSDSLDGVVFKLVGVWLMKDWVSAMFLCEERGTESEPVNDPALSKPRADWLPLITLAELRPEVEPEEACFALWLLTGPAGCFVLLDPSSNDFM